MDELDSRLLAWLRDWYHTHSLLDLSQEDEKDDTEQDTKEDAEKPGELILDLALQYGGRHHELWLLNEGRTLGKDRPATEAERDERTNQTLTVTVELDAPKKKGDLTSWRFDAGEAAGPLAGGGFAGRVVYDPGDNTFSFKDVIMTCIS